MMTACAFRGATCYEAQLGRVWIKFLRPRYWRSSGLRHLITLGLEEPALQTYLILYGADNTPWLLEAETPAAALAEFNEAVESDAIEGEANEIWLCTPLEMPTNKDS